MQPFFEWLGHFWWLIFPVMGMLGGLGRAWQKALERRHRRRLEIIRAKGELKAARAAASAPAPKPEPQSQQLERLFAAHDEVTRRWLEYELDVAKLIAFPAMSDGRQPLTAAFLRAKKKADNLRPESAKAKIGAEQLAEYRDAVTDYEVAFDVAERDARRVRDSSFSEAERKRLDTAKQLLTVAIDQAATPAERQVAYRRVRQELDGLISLSDGAIDVLEKKVALELTTGGIPTVAASRAEDPPRPDPEHREPEQSAAPDPNPEPWPVPARSTNTAPGRVVRPRRLP